MASFLPFRSLGETEAALSIKSRRSRNPAGSSPGSLRVRGSRELDVTAAVQHVEQRGVWLGDRERHLAGCHRLQHGRHRPRRGPVATPGRAATPPRLLTNNWGRAAATHQLLRAGHAAPIPVPRAPVPGPGGARPGRSQRPPRVSRRRYRWPARSSRTSPGLWHRRTAAPESAAHRSGAGWGRSSSRCCPARPRRGCRRRGLSVPARC
jgi:hypothetical protein